MKKIMIHCSSILHATRKEPQQTTHNNSLVKEGEFNNVCPDLSTDSRINEDNEMLVRDFPSKDFLMTILL
jgi:hypothetical protein